MFFGVIKEINSVLTMAFEHSARYKAITGFVIHTAFICILILSVITMVATFESSVGSKAKGADISKKGGKYIKCSLFP